MNSIAFQHNKKIFVLVLALVAIISSVVISVAYFTDRANRTTTVQTATFDAEGYELARTAPDGYLTTGETAEILLKESNNKSEDISSQITLTASWDSPVPDIYPWGNTNIGNIQISLDGEEVSYTENKEDNTISFTLPKKTLSSGAADIESTLLFQIPSDLAATGTLKFSFDQIMLRSGEWTYECEKDTLTALDFTADVAWNISKDQTTAMDNPNCDILAILDSGAATDEYTLSIIKNGSDTNTNYGQMMNWTAKDQTPWAKHNITDLSLSEGITTIGCYAFAGEAGITELSLPSTVNTIGISAFQGSGLSGELVLPSTIKIIESLAFGDLTDVDTITFEHGSDDNLTLPDNTSEGEGTSGAFYVSDYVKTILNFNGNTVAEQYDWVADQRMKVGISSATLSYEKITVGGTAEPVLIISPTNYDDYQSIQYKLTAGNDYAEIDADTGALTGKAGGTVTVQVTIIDGNDKTVQASTDVIIQETDKALGDTNIGDTVYLNENGAPVAYIVVNQGVPSSRYDSSCDGTWLLRKEPCTTMGWYRSASNIYSSSDIHTYLNGDFLGTLDANVQSAIKPVKIPYGVGGGSTSIKYGADGLSTQVFLLSLYEVGYTSSISSYIPYDGAVLSYFDGNGNNNNNRIAYMDGTAVDWWSRSPHIGGNTNSSWSIATNGNLNGYSSSAAFGVRPAMILPGDAVIKGDGTIDVSNVYFDIDSEPSQRDTLTYTGDEQTVTWDNYDSTQLTISGTTSATRAGTYTATFTPKEHYRWSDGTTDAKEVEWTIEKAKGSLSLSSTTIELDEGSTATIEVTRVGDGVISATSNDKSVATVSVDGTTITVTGVAAGNATITVAVAEGTNYKAPANVTVATTINATGIAAGSLAVGSSVYLNVDGVRTEFIVVNQGNPDSRLYDASCDGTWLLMKDIYENRPWNSSGSNFNSYKASTIHTYLNGTFLNLFDADVKAQIKTVKIPYVNGYGESPVASGSSGLSAQIFLLSGYEVGWTQSTSSFFPVDGTCLSYFSGLSSADSKRIAYLNGSVGDWWLRSTCTRSNTNAWHVNTSGNYSNSNCSDSYGIRPAMIVPSDMKFTEDAVLPNLGEVAVGSSVYLNENGSPVEYLVVNQGIPSNSSLYDSSCDGTWLLRKEIYDTQYWRTSTYNNTYETSTVHSYLNSTILGLFDTNTQNAIRQATIPFVDGVGTSSVASGANGLSTKLFLLSGYEVGWTTLSNEYIPEDGACISYFSGLANAHSKRSAYLNGTATAWWTRSPSKANARAAFAIGTSGGDEVQQVATVMYGVRPALIMPSDASINSDGTVDVSNLPVEITSPPSPKNTMTYTGEDQAVVWENYDSTQLTISGTTSASAAGTYTATFTPKPGYRWSDGTTDAKEVEWTIEKAKGSLSLSATTIELDEGDTATIKVTRAGDGMISATSSDKSVATASVDGTTILVTGVATGTATITVSVAEGTNHKAPANAAVATTINATGIAAGDLAVGSSVYLKENGTPVEYLVVHQGNPDSSLYDNSCDGTWLLRKTSYTLAPWTYNSVSGTNDYENSNIHNVLNNSFLARFDSNVQSAIKQVKIPYRAGGGTSSTVTSGTNGLSTKAFLLSAAEVSITYSGIVPVSGAELSYFKGLGNDNEEKRNTYYDNDKSISGWWLRDPYLGNSAQGALIVGGGFSLDTVYQLSSGVRPAMIMSSGCTVDANGFIVAP